MINIDSGIELINQGRINALMDTVEQVDPLLHRALNTLEDVVLAIAQQDAERKELITDGLLSVEDEYEFNPKDFRKSFRYVIEMLRNNGNIPDSVEDIFDRVKYANAWTEFTDALCMKGVGYTDVIPGQNAEEAIMSLSKLHINDEFVRQWLHPNGFSLYRHDTKSPYFAINEELTLPYFTYTEGVMVYQSPVTTSSKDLWWYNVLDEAHTRWEKILTAVADIHSAADEHGEPIADDDSEQFFPQDN